MTEQGRFTRSPTFRSLHSRNYRLYFFPQLVSATGSWMNIVALGWVVLKLTGSGADVGLLVAAGTLPTLLGGAWAGLIADRVDKRRLLLVTDAAMGLLAFGVAGMVLTDTVHLWVLFTYTIADGCVGTLAVPVHHAFVSELVEPDEVSNAVGLNSAVLGSARIVGAGAAGLLIALVGTWACFVIDALSHGASIVGLLAMRVGELNVGDRLVRAPGQIRAGFRYVAATPDLRSTLLGMAAAATLSLNFAVLLPLLAKDTFHRGGGAFGLMTSVMAAGSLVGSLVIAGWPRPTRRRLVGASLGLGAGTMVTAAAPGLSWSLIPLAAVGLCVAMFVTTASVILQLGSRHEMRGRVMALYGLVLTGTTPVGAPLIGWVSEVKGPRSGLLIGGVASVGAAAVFGFSGIDSSLTDSSDDAPSPVDPDGDDAGEHQRDARA